MNGNIVTIPKKVSRGEELVVIRRQDFDVFLRWQEEVKDVLAKVRRGQKEYRLGKTRVVSSPRELL